MNSEFTSRDPYYGCLFLACVVYRMVVRFHALLRPVNYRPLPTIRINSYSQPPLQQPKVLDGVSCTLQVVSIFFHYIIHGI